MSADIYVEARLHPFGHLIGFTRTADFELARAAMHSAVDAWFNFHLSKSQDNNTLDRVQELHLKADA